MNAAGTTVIADNVRTNRSKGGVHQQRRCFLIDSLLEERQKQLAAAAAAAAETNRGQNGQIPGGKRVGKQEEWQKTEMTADGREEMLLARADTADQENDRREEDEEEGEGGGGEGMEMADEGAEGADEGQKKAILEALAKLVPILGEDKEELKRTGDRSIGSEREESHTVVGQHPHLPMAITSDFLQRLRFLQQQHSSTSSSVSPLACTWPAQTNPGSFNPANLRFPSFFPSPTFLSQMNNSPSTNFLPNFTNSWRPLMSKRSENAKKLVIPATVSGPAWPIPSFLNARTGPSAAMLASIGVFRAAAVAAMASASVRNNANQPTDGTSNEEAPIPNGKRPRHSNGSSKVGKDKNEMVGRHQQQRRHEQQQRTFVHSKRSAGGPSRSSNVKKYRCDICEKTFSRSNTLITHKRIHTGEKPFRCEHCGRAFRQPGNLTRHAYTHTTVKPFVCAECGKAFNRASNLQTHVRVHSAGNGTVSSGSAGEGVQQAQQCTDCRRQSGTRTELMGAHKC